MGSRACSVRSSSSTVRLLEPEPALEAAIAGIPAIAYSMTVNEESLFAFEYNQPDFSNAAEIAGEIARDVLENGMPEGAEVLNVTFPPGSTPRQR